MKIASIKTTTGKLVNISQKELYRAGIAFLRQYYPNNVAIVAEEINDFGRIKEVPAAVFMLLKNPKDVVYYTDVVELKETNNQQ